MSVLNKIVYTAPEAGWAQIPAAGLVASAGAMALEPGNRDGVGDGDAFGAMKGLEADVGAPDTGVDECLETAWLPTLEPPHDATSHSGRNNKARNERTDMPQADPSRRRFGLVVGMPTPPWGT